MKKLYAGFGVVVLLVVLIMGLKGLNHSQDSKSATLKIGLNPWIGNGLYFIAQEKGFFEANNINVKLESFDDGAIGKQLLNSGKVDVLPITPETVVIIKDSGLGIKIIGMTVASKGADGIIATRDVQNLTDLRGKKVAFEVGSPSHFLLSYFLDQQNLDTSILDVVNTTAPDAGAAFVAGQVDAAVTWEPWLSKASERPGGHVLLSSKTMELFPDMMIIRNDVLESNPEAAAALLRSLFAAIDWINANNDEAAEIIGKNFQISPEEVKAQLATIQWLTYDDNIVSFKSGQPQDLLQKAGDLWLRLDLIRNPISGTNLVDDSILINLYK
ncbi:MAG: hypothetical protein A3J07_00890 [Candidatus Doudnabacteria bacterium RIFCSPLOWO2_02_FULL_49_13]|uniref:Solute-binding protein family 3/N-terminal domain-containing protein n=1 Tax=Candidatus Doudnabacteria bacterium RIFCSPHIGHO2_12_FULL_48_16 TaxID=1817838 RepID=A0A1F5PKA8_9BACT|nr:MAG: hypothetical protein A3B77_04455 [Candidatus Doudnabacteria bacterium RIFCSPHIGHO2_02_FULL_49_24]OGE89906.1 MAG: hypothetical protein A2760_04350 [Candidatus Doudnabacteria bacterium RIFCSPHIGHO2_01_FULL_50_67]OGE90307.1 MAG: hypothetical protein A3E29_04400 [Candidatus Doudnabacteria bacterium RIFCSPHIGHO2_12_FULL_48_16]OGE96735.1 MAG: hypothetical protein A2990_00390 [Candidatus Doudnabacteria bacterium RIFCSPLOWO2_01_FULL_49_40]OGF02363.1 MAG: hypothetical protein A3J07_00890 [Candid